MSSNHSSSSSHDISHHVVPIPVYFATLVTLAVLMVVTVVASQIVLPGGTLVNNIVAMAIACTKAYLVVMFFMNVRNGSKLIKMWAVLGFVWFGLLFIMYADYEFRQYEMVGSWDKKDPGSAMPRTKTYVNQPGTPEYDPNMNNVRVR